MHLINPVLWVSSSGQFRHLLHEAGTGD